MASPAHKQDADIVLLLSHPDAHYHSDSDQPGEADIIAAKKRSGRSTASRWASRGHYSPFTPHGA